MVQAVIKAILDGSPIGVIPPTVLKTSTKAHHDTVHSLELFLLVFLRFVVRHRDADDQVEVEFLV